MDLTHRLSRTGQLGKGALKAALSVRGLQPLLGPVTDCNCYSARCLLLTRFETQSCLVSIRTPRYATSQVWGI